MGTQYIIFIILGMCALMSKGTVGEKKIRFRHHTMLMRLMKYRACFLQIVTISAVQRSEQPQTEGFRFKWVKYKFVSFIEDCAK